MIRPGRRRDGAPADRRVVTIVVAICAIGLIGLIAGLLVSRPFYTGTNSVRARGFVAETAPGSQLCMPRIFVPAGTARLQMEVLVPEAPRPALEAVLQVGSEQIRRTLPPAARTGPQKIEFAIPKRPGEPEAVPASLCVRNVSPAGAGTAAVFGGTNGAPGNVPAPTVDGVPQDRQIALWFLPEEGAERSLLALLPDVMARAALFRPGWVGTWTPWLLVFLVVPGLGFLALRLLLRAGSPARRRVPLGLAVALIAFGNAAAWATLTPSFNSPDESEHFAYAQYLAETGRAIDSTPGRPAYSTAEVLALQATRVLASNEPGDGRPPWLQGAERRWRERVATEPAPADNGGGFTTCCNPHSPAYYSLLAPAYAVAGESTFAQLWAMRLVSALLAAIAAACAYGIVRELLPARPVLGVAAGVLVAFQPMFAFMGGSVNNDMGVNAGAAVVLYLLVRGLRRGLDLRLGLALGAAVVIMPLLKGTGYALYPVVLFAVLGMLWRRHDRRALLGMAGVAVSFLVLTLVWGEAIAPSFERSSFTTPGGGVPGENIAPLTNLPGYLSFMWQIFLPKLGFMTDLWLQTWPFYDIYVVRGFGAFGWYQVLYPSWIYAGIVALIAIVLVLGIVTAIREWPAVRRRALEVLVLVGAGAGVIAAVEALYYVSAPRGLFVAEMGRYAFPAITAYATLAVVACFGAGRRNVTAVAAGLATGMVVLNTVAQLVMLGGFYT